MTIRLLHTLLVLLLIPLVTSCSQDEQPSEWSQAFTPLQGHFAISDRFKQQKTEFDFNGDGVADAIYYTDVIGDISDLSSTGFASISLFQPWLKMDDQKHGAKTAIVIIHGGSLLADGSLSTVIHDKNDISILDTAAMLQSEVIKKDLIAQLEEPDLSASAKGDIILIPTEAGIDSFIYWDGANYQLYEVINIP